MKLSYRKTWAVIYTMAALAYASEVFGEITGYRLYRYTWEVHELIEMVTLLGFALGGYIMWLSHKQLDSRNKEVEQLLRAAQGEFYTMVERRFDHWGFTDAEKDIARMTVKGLTVGEIAKIRETSEGTVKSQNNAIYRKAGVKNRTQLLGDLIEELLFADSPS
ncbi:MAG: helix-turn-helix transcriptional regulator [Planktomarina sp.]